MQRFARLFEQLTQDDDVRTQATLLHQYLHEASEKDAAWAVTLLAAHSGHPTGLRLTPRALRASAREASGWPEWLFDACLEASGDLADTVAQAIPHPLTPDPGSLTDWMEQRLLPLSDRPVTALAAATTRWWPVLAPSARRLLAKLLGAAWRSPVSPQVLQTALARHAGLDTRQVAQRLGRFVASPHDARHRAYQALIARSTPESAPRRTHRFTASRSAATLPDEVQHEPGRWWVSWQYEGVPAQLIRHNGQSFLWLADDRLVNDHLPEVLADATAVPDNTVIEGQLLVWPHGAPKPDADPRALAQRLNPRPASLANRLRAPVRFVAYDLLEDQGVDLSHEPLRHRQQLLAQRLSVARPALTVAARLHATDTEALLALHRSTRQQHAIGLWLRHEAHRHGDAHTPCDTPWCWPATPLSIHAVLVYAQTGGGMTRGYAHYSFAVWSREPQHSDEVAQTLHRLHNRQPGPPNALSLITVAKVSKHDAGAWHAKLTQCVQEALTVRQGPIHTVHPQHIVELHVGAMAPSTRHHCGLNLQDVRVHRIQPEKTLHDVDNLAVLRAMLDGPPP